MRSGRAGVSKSTSANNSKFCATPVCPSTSNAAPGVCLDFLQKGTKETWSVTGDT
jgi:hypothetical protein